MNLIDFGICEKEAVAIIKITDRAYELANEKELENEWILQSGIVSYGRKMTTLEGFKKEITKHYGITKFKIINESKKRK